MSVAMDFPSIMVSRSEKRSRGRADRIGSSRWMVRALDDPDAEESERSDAVARGGRTIFFFRNVYLLDKTPHRRTS